MDKFRIWFAKVEREAPLTEVGKIATAAGFHVAHLGGDRLCWEKLLPGDAYLWIYDQANGLGEHLNETYLVGCYGKDGEVIAEGDVPGLQAALKWCEAREGSNSCRPG